MYRKRHFQLCGYLCLLCVWFHISCIWLPIHVSVRINFFFFFFISQSNDQPTYKLYTIYTRTVLQCNNHFRSFFFWCFVVQNSRELLLYLWNEMLWEHYVFLLAVPRSLSANVFIVPYHCTHFTHWLQLTYSIAQCLTLFHLLRHLHPLLFVLYLVLGYFRSSKWKQRESWWKKNETWIQIKIQTFWFCGCF